MTQPNLIADARERGWLVEQLAAWPTRVDPEKTTNIEYLMKSAAAALRDERERNERLAAALEEIGNGKAFRLQRFAEDDDAEYFLRAQRQVQMFARTALEDSTP